MPLSCREPDDGGLLPSRENQVAQSRAEYLAAHARIHAKAKTILAARHRQEYVQIIGELRQALGMGAPQRYHPEPRVWEPSIEPSTSLPSHLDDDVSYQIPTRPPPGDRYADLRSGARPDPVEDRGEE